MSVGKPKEERFSVRLVEYVDGSTSCELGGNPTLVQVLGIIELWRACQRLNGLDAFADRRIKPGKAKQ